MQSQVIWGIFFLLTGVFLLVLTPLFFFWSIPFSLLGISLIVFRHRESIIEEVEE